MATLVTKINSRFIMITALLICKFAPIFELPKYDYVSTNHIIKITN